MSSNSSSFFLMTFYKCCAYKIKKENIVDQEKEHLSRRFFSSQLGPGTSPLTGLTSVRWTLLCPVAVTTGKHSLNVQPCSQRPWIQLSVPPLIRWITSLCSSFLWNSKMGIITLCQWTETMYVRIKCDNEYNVISLVPGAKWKRNER